MVWRAAEATRPKLVVHGHYHVRYSSLLELLDGTTVRVEGISDDSEGAIVYSAAILDLGDLSVSVPVRRPG